MDPLAALKARKAKLLADVEALDADARELERLKALADKYGFELTEKAQTKGQNGVPVSINIEGPAYRAAINVAENAIRAAGQPLEFKEIYDACVSQRVPLGGKRPESTLSAYLSHSKSTVQSIRKGVYWLKNAPMPQ